MSIEQIASSSQKNSADFNQPLPLHIANLVCVRAGKAMPFAREQMSAIDKAPIKEAVAVNFMGLSTDEQADRRHHGGPLKAVHQLATSTYDKINTEFGLKVRVGTLGENLTTEAVTGLPAMDESTVCIGDVFQYGQDEIINGNGGDSVQLRIVQPRRPCYKINDQIGQFKLNKVPNIASWVTKQGIAGWYFEVVRDGMINADLPVYLIERPYPFATLEKLWQLSNSKEKFDAEVIEPWLSIECLEDSWKTVLAKKIRKD
ncbi:MULTISPECIES: MOSC domain-containing protein [Psychrobacter]|jgi:MOSC domain-containing protein YiiM|uniref:MOSC domain-containing protein n=1 Tax=Psychrobacter faecalis TaxID=180588 RepID=A0ABT9HGM1_9GAMM|nr:MULTISPECIES: MOSC domain-containing protein [Psychrobacter]MDP4544915.1 MOSC domain-containing protein [Psychrobacter faecalis]OAP70153.1 molybdenum cofactor biosysynthesis protein [Psychrobacter sp. SHUES1]HCR88364.1 MOSC domain-containing protein [Psychrobacter sp.]